MMFDDMRHELIGEIGREAVWELLRDFILGMEELPSDQIQASLI